VPSHAERQRHFARAILDPVLAVPPGVHVPAGAARSERFAVYRNNVLVGRVDALRSSFPVVERLVGAEFFAAMARVHAFESPPSSPVLLEYGSEFAEFIERFEPAASVPYLADVARLEWHWLEAYHAADASPLTRQALEGVPCDHLPALTLQLHPSARLLRFAYPALSIWRLHKQDADVDSAAIEFRAEATLLVRPQASVEALELSPGAFVFLHSVRSGQTLEVAAVAAMKAERDIDLVRLLPALFAAGVFAGFTDTAGEHR
jgi:hypothetical protein